MSTPISLGRFDLLEPIAAGGMGVVWRAVHRSDGTAVAVKVLTPSAADREDFILALRDEIRAVAGLNHPHVVWIHAHGEVDAAAAEASGGTLTEGGPWLALELCEGNTLRELAPKLDWEAIRGVLLDLLDALAHAHAHGVIHRDIKLANVLVGGARPGIKLTDFGIMNAVEGRAFKTDSVSPVNAGTPAYMAPEQLLGRADAQGPWTDLYQFGVMAWKLITWGCPAEGDVRELIEAKNNEDWVPFRPVVPVPDGVDAWLMRLMKPWPEERFRCAADAAYALKKIGPAPPGERRLPEELWDPDSTTMIGPEDMMRSDPDSQAPPTVASPLVTAPLPRDWREVETDATLPTSLIGAGLGLFGLRKVPVIGREAERDALWAGFTVVHRSRTPRVVILRGPVGSGKSHLADWMCRKAEEVGGGIALRGEYLQEVGGLQGVELAIARYLKVQGLSKPELRSRVRTFLERHETPNDTELDQLTAILHASTGDPAGQFKNRSDRHELICRVLDRLTRERPVILSLDDVHYGRDGVRLARHLLRRGPSAVLLLLTVRDDVIARQKTDLERLGRVEARSACASVYIGALSREHRQEFVRRLLGLEPKLARQIADKTAGNPSMAAQIITDWVDKGLLEPSPSGFRLREEGLELPLPPELHDPWRRRVARLLRDKLEWRVPLELAAVLGIHVHTSQWTKVCRETGVEVPRRLLTAMLQHRYIVMDEGSRGRSWSFSHSMFREAILMDAEDLGRLQTHHRACLAALFTDAGDSPDDGRRAWHMLGAGETLQVIDPLERGAIECMAEGEHEEATRLLDAREKTMESMGVRPSDTRWGRGWLLRSRLHFREGEWEDAITWVNKTVDTARNWGWRDLEIGALALLAGNIRSTPVESALELLARARKLVGDGVSPRSRTTVDLIEADLARERGLPRESVTWARQALTSARSHGNELVSACLGALIRAEIELGNDRKALGLVAEAERMATSGTPYDRAQAAFLRAHVQRVRRDLHAAEDAVEEAWAMSTAIADPNRMVVKATKGLVLVEQNQLHRARNEFAACLRSSVRQAHLWSHLGMLVCAADDPDDTLWAAHLEPVARYLERGWTDPAIARYGLMAAESAERAGYTDRAEEARLLASKQPGAGRRP